MFFIDKKARPLETRRPVRIRLAKDQKTETGISLDSKEENCLSINEVYTCSPWTSDAGIRKIVTLPKGPKLSFSGKNTKSPHCVIKQEVDYDKTDEVRSPTSLRNSPPPTSRGRINSSSGVKTCRTAAATRSAAVVRPPRLLQPSTCYLLPVPNQSLMEEFVASKRVPDTPRKTPARLHRFSVDHY